MVVKRDPPQSRTRIEMGGSSGRARRRLQSTLPSHPLLWSFNFGFSSESNTHPRQESRSTMTPPSESRGPILGTLARAILNSAPFTRLNSKFKITLKP